MNIVKFEKALSKSARERISYYREWLFDEPFKVDNLKYKESIVLQKAIMKIIQHVVLNYEEYYNLMPIGEKSKKIFDLWKDKDYEIGSYRTDFVIDKNYNYRPIEITCRFALNGFFISNILSPRNVFDKMERLDWQPYDEFKDYFFSLIENKDEIILLRDSESRNESKIFEAVFRDAEIPYIILGINDLINDNGDYCHALVINELSIKELEDIPLCVHEKLKKSHFLNDIRTILLVHDKRFFHLLFKKDIQEKILNNSEISLFKKLLVPTYIYSKDSFEWNNAIYDKNSWIIKHTKLGKSEMIYAGVVTNDSEWRQLFERPDIEDFVLQRWIEQPKFLGSIKGKPFDDFVTGSYLFFNEHHFGFSEFRTSSHPVTNVVDHRKSIGVIDLP